MPLEGPWYTLDEAVQKLNNTRSDVFYEIEQGNLTGVLICRKTPFLVYSTTKNGKKVGHCHFYYQGPVAASPQLLKALVLNRRADQIYFYQPLDLSSISHFSGNCPFEDFGPLDDWEPLSIDEAFASGNHTVLMPHKTQDFKQGLRAAFEVTKEPDYDPLAPLKALNAAPLTYSWNFYASWKLKDLRIPASEIRKIQSPLLKEVKKVASRGKATRNHQLKELITRVLLDHPNASSQDLWKIIRAECDSEENIYDTDNILLAVDADAIDWVSTYGVEQSLKRRSFTALVSKIRKELADNAIN
ncbi:hypothetical protein HBA55_30105 [Pseudomaricurvus alkylphenolicus]|uniref:hypothetical protein n=1 Tax=Pseudomaricurvus alkylphenolicus TaxID=1306991 RepID=UPI00141D7FDA|nr:hypothetical protein [Pseudomaricurvus alkylphenolicus]NIB43894.1 hypothetical protein [Pseudomaricurvus alkylphenolicus]